MHFCSSNGRCGNARYVTALFTGQEGNKSYNLKSKAHGNAAVCFMVGLKLYGSNFKTTVLCYLERP